MAVKSIIDIDLDDSKFVRFNELFQKYQASLAKMPGAWAEVGKESKSVQKGFEAATAALLAQNELAGKAAKAGRDVENSVTKQGRAWHDMARDTKNVAANIKNATFELLKWAGLTSVFSGLLGAGGLFGIDRMAADVANSRRSALGLGVGYGQQQAFKLNFGQFVDTNSLLGNVNSSLNDATSKGYVGLLAAGISRQFLQSHNAADVSVELLQRLPQLMAGTPRELRGAKLHALGLDQIIGTDDAIRYLNSSPEQRQKQASRYRQDASGLDVETRTQLAWTDFITQMSRASGQIENVFVRGLVPLEQPLEHLSASFESLVAAFLKSDTLKKWIGDLSDGIEGAAKYIGTPKFKTDVEAFAKGIGDMVGAIGKFISWAGGLFGAKTVAGTPSTGSHNEFLLRPNPRLSPATQRLNRILGISPFAQSGPPRLISPVTTAQPGTLSGAVGTPRSPYGGLNTGLFGAHETPSDAPLAGAAGTRALSTLPPRAPVPVAGDLAFPSWLSGRSRRELSGVNRPLAEDLLAASQATGLQFQVLQGLRTRAEADTNAARGTGVRNSQHLYGAAADIKLTDAGGRPLTRAEYQRFAAAFHAAASGAGRPNERWLGDAPDAAGWHGDIAHFDQGIGYGQAHARDPFGRERATAADIADGRRDVYNSAANPFAPHPHPQAQGYAVTPRAQITIHNEAGANVSVTGDALANGP